MTSYILKYAKFDSNLHLAKIEIKVYRISQQSI